jgi:hypothetical protein
LIDFNPCVPLRQSSRNEVIASLTTKFSSLWNWTSDLPCLIGKTYNLREQQEFERKSEKLLLDAEPASRTPDGVHKHMSRLRDCVRDLVVETVDRGKREQIKEMLIAFSEAGDEFVRRSREFDEDLRFDGIIQALRNVWIVNSMQAAYGIPICVNPSGFAYSLLYTYSDNYLDSMVISEHKKEEFGNVFGLRLAGFDVPENTPLVSKVSSLVRLIEAEYPRDLFPEVYSSLLAIHRAQLGSLQQRVNEPLGGKADILHLSVEKGGTSVVADACLAKGRLTLAETEFAFGYGVVLQFIDDLQDVKEDLLGGSETVFTRAAGEGTLDAITNRLVRCLGEVLVYVSPSHGPQADGVRELIFQGSLGLILESIALNPEMFSGDFTKTMEQHSPLRFEAIRRIYQKRASLETTIDMQSEHWTTLNGRG